MSAFQQPAHRPVHTFRAAFDSECETCDGAIFEGDEIGYLLDETKPSCIDCILEETE